MQGRNPASPGLVPLGCCPRSGVLRAVVGWVRLWLIHHPICCSLGGDQGGGVGAADVAHHLVLPCACSDGCYRDRKVALGREWKSVPKLACYIRPPKKRSIRRG